MAGMRFSKEAEEARMNLEKLAEDLKKRADLCDAEGHVRPVWFAPDFVRRPYRVEGICKYCLRFTWRRYTPEEKRNYKEFLRKMHEPMMI